MQNIEITVTDGKSNHDYVLHNVVAEIDDNKLLKVERLDTGDLYGFPLSSVVVYHAWETEDE